MDIQEITERFRARMGEDSGLRATVKFDCGDDGVIVLDGRSQPNAVHNDDGEADCTICISREDLVALLGGHLNPAVAFMTGKIKVSGDMSLALKLQRVM